MSEDLYCVYKHTSPNNKVYIGITRTSPERRWCNGYGYYHNEYFYKAIKKYGWDNFTHEILFDGLTKECACQIERDLILAYKSNDPMYGYNLTDGGEAGTHYSQVSIERMSKSKIGMYAGEKNPRYGKKVSEETREKIRSALIGKFAGDRNPNYGRPMSDEQKALISKAKTGKHYPKLSDSVKNSPLCIAEREKRMKPILQYTRDGEFIKRWESAPEASEALIGFRRGQSNICSCANGNLKTAYGFVWRYESDMNVNIKDVI